MNRLRKLQCHEAKFIRNPVANVSIICRLTGKINAKELSAAIGKLLIKHPLTTCKTQITEDGFWLIRDSVKELPLRVEKRTGEHTWKTVFTEEHKKAFNIEQGPLIKFCLIQGDRASEFIGICQHAICDGTGLAYLMADVLAFLEDPGLEVKELPLPRPLTPENIADLYRESSLAGKLKKLVIRQMNKKWEKQKVIFDQADLETISRTLWSKHSYKIVDLELDRQQLKNLVDTCHIEKVSINSALTTAFMGAYKKICGPFKKTKQSVAVPVNLRERIKPPAGNVLDLYVGSAMFKFRYDHQITLWENARIFNTGMKKNVNDKNLFKGFYETAGLDAFLLDGMSFALIGKDVDPSEPRYKKLRDFAEDKKNMAVVFVKRFLTFIPGTIMTNLARLKIKENYNSFSLDRIYFAPSSSPHLQLAIGAATVADCLVVTLNYAEANDNTELTDKMVAVRNLAAEMLKIV